MTRPTEQILELARRCEKATAEQQRELLNEAYYVLFPEPNTERERRFQAMLDAEAYESAAMALVPEKTQWPWNITMATAYGSASVIPNHGESYGVNDPFAGHCHGAATPALALCAASLRARAAMEASNAQQ